MSETRDIVERLEYQVITYGNRDAKAAIAEIQRLRTTTLGRVHARHLAAKLIAWANTKPTPKARPRNGK